MAPLTFSARSMRAYAALYRPYNDIDIYVEDRTLAGLYERVFNRMLGTRGRVTSVIPMDGKIGVIEEARRLKADTSRKRFFLVDGDFDWAVGRQSRARNLYYLKCYSFENLVWDYQALVKVASILSPQSSSAEIATILTHDHLRLYETELLTLFLMYATSKTLGSPCQTVSYSIARLLTDDDRTLLCADKMRLRLRALYRELAENYPLQLIVGRRRAIWAKLNSAGLNDHRFISGKDYLIPLLLNIFQSKFNFRGNRHQLLSLILEGADFSVDRGLRRALRRAAL